jgi:hypothetical protein
MNDYDERLLRNLESASAALKRQTGGKAGEGSEKVYGIAYKECVKAGLKPKIKKRYR